MNPADDKAFGEASVRTLARSFSWFYTELIKEGVPPDAALVMTNSYIVEIARNAANMKPPEHEKR